jgi:uncharacterized repeat protein (TIGR01451 family)
LEDRIALATYTVNDAGDASDRDLGDGQALTDGGVVTLRSAIEQAVYDGGGTIHFQGDYTIDLTRPLPGLASPITIDGTRGGSTPNVEVRGGGVVDLGLVVGSGCTVRGLIMNGFASAAITFQPSGGSGNVQAIGDILIEKNYLGTDRPGTARAGTQGAGIDVLHTSVKNVTIRENVISGNDRGIRLVGSNNHILANHIGTDVSGSAPIGNRLGVLLESGEANEIIDNVIGANFDGIFLTKPTTTTIQKNFIGTDRGATADLGNRDNGIVIVQGGDNRIGGDQQSDGNVIAFNGHGTKDKGNGVRIMLSTGNRILSNLFFQNANRGIAIYDNLGQSWDEGDEDNGPNRMQNAPYVEEVQDGQMIWWVRGKPGATYQIQLFQTLRDERAGSARQFSDELQVTADENGLAMFESTNVPFLTATATDAAGNTSELGFSDTDGDGIYDPWEVHGIDWDLDGNYDLDLPAHGARWDHKDVFVEADAMAGYGPQPLTGAEIQLLTENQGLNLNTFPAGVVPTGTALDAVIAAFRDAPVGNPSGGGGVRLHIDPLDATLPASFQLDWKVFDALKEAHFGTPQERQQSNWRAIKESRQLVYRYALFAVGFNTDYYGLAEMDRIGPDPFVSAGKYLGGNDFQIAVGRMKMDFFDSPLNEAAAFMHELGHTLGLGHGGADDINFKPNFHSLMNYTWTLANPSAAVTDPRIKRSFRLDYSREVLNTLDESDLREEPGIGGRPGDFVEVFYLDADTGTWKRTIVSEGGGWSDFDADHVPDEPYAMRVSDRALHEVLASPYFVLQGHNDWNSLIYNFRHARNLRNGEHPETEDDGDFRVDPEDVDVVPGTADLVLTQVASPTATTIGNSVVYTLTVTNNGPDWATDVKVIDTLPGGVTLVSADPSSGDSVQTVGGVLTFSLGDLASGNHATVTVVVMPDGPGTFSNRGLALTRTTDPDLENNHSSEEATVAQDLEIVAPPPADLQEGQTYTGQFGFTDTSAGPWTATIDYGDGSPVETQNFATPLADIPLSHQYLKNGDWFLRVTISSAASGQVARATAAIPVANEAPYLGLSDAGSTTPRAGTPRRFSVNATDLDTRFTYRVNWGDGGPAEEFVGPNSHEFTHVFAAPGDYTVRCVAIDPDGAASAEQELAITVYPPRPAPSPLPTALEQEFLERLNDARQDPAAYGRAIELDAILDWQPVQPLTFDPNLLVAAHAHSQDMWDREYFSHFSPEGDAPWDRAEAAGYIGLVWESLLLSPRGGETTATFLESLVKDWMEHPTYGHRVHMLATEHRQVGIGIEHGEGDFFGFAKLTLDSGSNLNDGEAFLTGVVYHDLNRNGLYDAGEGLEGVTIAIDGIGSTDTWSSGGYSYRLAPGTYVVTASGGGLPAPVTRSVVLGVDEYGSPVNERLGFRTEPAPGSLPHELFAPEGVGPGHWVGPDEMLAYSIRVANTDPQYPIRNGMISLTLDPALDSTTFELGDIRVGTMVIDVPAGQQSYSTELDMTGAGGTPLILRVVAALEDYDYVSWWLYAIDPVTGEFVDSSTGFLSYQETMEVSWRIRPIPDLTTGTRINAQAHITTSSPDGGIWPNFFTNAPFNTIDAGPPTSSVGALPATTSQTTFTVTWSGSDDTGGSGIAAYDVLVSDNGDPFILWKDDTPELSAAFTGAAGHTYAFYSVATDNVGHVEAQAAVADAQTSVGGNPGHHYANPYDVDNDDAVTPLDVLILINYINAGAGDSPLPAPPASPPPYYDVSDGDGVTALDVLLVINYINSRPQGLGEGESHPSPTSSETTAVAVALELIFDRAGVCDAEEEPTFDLVWNGWRIASRWRLIR